MEDPKRILHSKEWVLGAASSPLRGLLTRKTVFTVPREGTGTNVNIPNMNVNVDFLSTSSFPQGD
jgi:hypothetical protein